MVNKRHRFCPHYNLVGRPDIKHTITTKAESFQLAYVKDSVVYYNLGRMV